MNDYKLDRFSVLVIGDDPDGQINKFDSSKVVDTPYILYKYSDLHKLRKLKIKTCEELIKSIGYGKNRNLIIDHINFLKKISDEDYYYGMLSELHSFDSDKNIITVDNPDGKWIGCEKGGKIFSNYLKDNNDNGVISAKKKDIDWSLTHMRQDKVNIYNRTWDLCVDKVEPENDKDRLILKNMSLYTNLFKQFSNKEDYIKMACSFWTYAIVNNGNWADMDLIDERIWIPNYYNQFIDKIEDDELITIYECIK